MDIKIKQEDGSVAPSYVWQSDLDIKQERQDSDEWPLGCIKTEPTTSCEDIETELNTSCDEDIETEPNTSCEDIVVKQESTDRNQDISVHEREASPGECYRCNLCPKVFTE